MAAQTTCWSQADIPSVKAEQISIFHLLPASGADYYAEKLKDFANRLAYFDLSICLLSKFYSQNGVSVSFSLASLEFSNIRFYLDGEF